MCGSSFAISRQVSHTALTATVHVYGQTCDLRPAINTAAGSQRPSLTAVTHRSFAVLNIKRGSPIIITQRRCTELDSAVHELINHLSTVKALDRKLQLISRYRTFNAGS